MEVGTMQVIAHNLTSMFTDRQLNISTKNKGRATEKLSSGYKINRAADDAAGLQISEKMRWQIRGLNRGAKNIEDGISLIQTADGAMSEMHSILQRIRELSVQAYNDTNTLEDRNAIQAEVDESLCELGRIADTTTFNTKHILQGDPVELIQITGDEEIGIQVRKTAETVVPEWLYQNMDHELVVHSGYTQNGQEQGNMIKTVSATDDTPDKYYGAQNPSLESLGYTHGGEWTDTISDNPSAKIDFKGLADYSTSALDLYNNLFDLIGSKISFGCGTCSSYINSITFAGNEPSMRTEGFENAEGATTDVQGNVNITDLGYFDEIRELLNKYGEDYENNNATSEAEKQDVKALADKIAGGLRDTVVSTLERNLSRHFDRVMKVDGNPTGLYIYDYRDSDKLTDLRGVEPDGTIADTSIQTTAKVTYVIDATMLRKGETGLVDSKMMIECGALAPNTIPLTLADVTLDKLGCRGYKINRYSTTLVYSDSYKNKLQEYYDSKQVVEKTGTRTEKYVVKPGKSPVYIDKTTYVNGEGKSNRILVQEGIPATYATRNVQYKYNEVVYAKPYPAPQSGDVTVQAAYDPDSLQIIDDAIAIVSRERSCMGALQNRLEHAYNINENVAENSQAYESRLRDADMADEVVDLTRHSILEQAGQSLLAQANQSMMAVVSLLNG